jgi:hypothetical protein
MHLVRHIRGKDSREETAVESQAHDPRGGGGTDRRAETDTFPIYGFLPDFLRERREPASSDEHDAQAGARGGASSMERYGDLAVHIASVLSAAEDAAEHIRQEAEQQAEQIRQVARREAGQIRHEAGESMSDSRRERAEAASYAGDVRAAADSYAEEKRLEAEAEAATIKVHAEYEARLVVSDAERRVEEIEEAARRREEERGKESRRVEERLKELLNTVGDLIERLEEQVRPEERVESTPPEAPLGKTVKKRPTRRAVS